MITSTYTCFEPEIWSSRRQLY